MKTEKSNRPRLHLAALSAGVAICLLTLASPALPASVGIGFRTGPSLASCSGLESLSDPILHVEGTPEIDLSHRTGLVIGGFLTFPVTRNIVIQPELVYSNQGSTRDVAYTQAFRQAEFSYVQDYSIHNTVKLNYMEMPLLVKYFFGDPSKSAPFVLAGPAVGLRVGSPRITHEISILTKQYDSVTDTLIAEIQQDLWLVSRIRQQLQIANLMFVVGGGYSFRIRHVSLSAELRYTYGLTDLVRREGLPIIQVPGGGQSYGTPYVDKCKASSVSLSVGVTLPLIAD
jgi:hypothetical protein